MMNTVAGRVTLSGLDRYTVNLFIFAAIKDGSQFYDDKFLVSSNI